MPNPGRQQQPRPGLPPEARGCPRALHATHSHRTWTANVRPCRLSSKSQLETRPWPCTARPVHGAKGGATQAATDPPSAVLAAPSSTTLTSAPRPEVSSRGTQTSGRRNTQALIFHAPAHPTHQDSQRHTGDTPHPQTNLARNLHMHTLPHADTYDTCGSSTLAKQTRVCTCVCVLVPILLSSSLPSGLFWRVFQAPPERERQGSSPILRRTRMAGDPM